jgi:hypothetical protein
MIGEEHTARAAGDGSPQASVAPWGIVHLSSAGGSVAVVSVRGSGYLRAPRRWYGREEGRGGTNETRDGTAARGRA